MVRMMEAINSVIACIYMCVCVCVGGGGVNYTVLPHFIAYIIAKSDQ